MMLRTPTISSRIATNTARPAPLMWVSSPIADRPRRRPYEPRLLVGAAGAGSARAGQGWSPADQILEAPYTPVVARLAGLRLDELPAPRLVSALGPPRSRPGQPDRADPRHGGYEHADHGGAEFALERDDRADAEIDRDGGDDRERGPAVA